MPAACGATPRAAEPTAHMHSSARPTPATCGGTAAAAAAAAGAGGGTGCRPSFGSSFGSSSGGGGRGGAGSVASSSLRRTCSAGAGVRRESAATAAAGIKHGSPLVRPSWMPQAAMEQATVLGSRLQVRPGLFAPQESDPTRLFEALLAASGR